MNAGLAHEASMARLAVHMDRLANRLVTLPRLAKRAMVVGVDGSLCVLTVWLALCVRQEGGAGLTAGGWWAAAVSAAVALPLFARSGQYRAIFRYSGGAAMTAVASVVAVYGAIYAAFFTLVGVEGVPRSVGVIQPVLLLAGVMSSRVLACWWLGRERQRGRSTDAARALIYGAGEAGCQLAQALAQSPRMIVVGFLDDDPHLQGGVVHGLPILDPAQLEGVVRRLKVSDVLLALPSASRQRRNEILDAIRQAHVAVRTLPALMELAHGEMTVGIRELDIDDLLGRAAVPPEASLMAAKLADKVVLVTGAGGSIGSELCRQIVQCAPSTLLLVERSEFALYAIHGELQELLARARLANPGGPAVRIVPLLASVGHERRIVQIMRTWRPDTVYHAAAYKHVPLVEHNPAEGIRNNVFGTLVAARAAARHGVTDFVLVSTDKAVRPTSVMGASKRLAEMVLQALAAESAQTPGGTRFSMVRFGNVLDSSGSVVPLFRKQIAEGGPITLTHPDITRYFMTIPEAAQLVIQAGAMAVGGDVFVLDMGAPMRVGELARRMVELSGLRVRDAADPAGDIEIRIVGLRPGEKLFEELLIGDDPQGTAHPRIMKARDDFLPWSDLRPQLQKLSTALQSNDIAWLRDQLAALVGGYRPEARVVDWVHVEQEALIGSDALPAEIDVVPAASRPLTLVPGSRPSLAEACSPASGQLRPVPVAVAIEA